jgi:hypothetical protein
LAAVAGALALMAYTAYRGSQQSSFFLEAVRDTYDLGLSQADIDGYYDLKDRLYSQHAEASAGADGGAATDDGDVAGDPQWVQRIPQEARVCLQKALIKRMVSCIDRLNQVQQDKPGNFALWRKKLVSEAYWNSLCDAEKLVTEEIESCQAEAEELRPGWKDSVFRDAVHLWRLQKDQEMEKKAAKKAVVNEKKEKEKEVKRKEAEERKKEEDKVREEKAAQKAMEKLLQEEERATKTKGKTGDRAPAPKSKGKKK